MKKSLERLLFMGVGGVLVLLGGVFLPQSKQVNAQDLSKRVIDTIVCKKLQVVDNLGNIRVGLGYDETGGFVAVTGKHKTGNFKPVIYITENNLGGSIHVFDKSGKGLAGLSIQESLPGKHGGIVIVKNNQSSRNPMKGSAAIYADEDGGGVVIHNNEGHVVEQLGDNIER